MSSVTPPPERPRLGGLADRPEIAARARRFGPLAYRELGWRRSIPEAPAPEATPHRLTPEETPPELTPEETPPGLTTRVPTPNDIGRALASHLDRWWESMDAPDPFVAIVEGPEGGEVVRGILAAGPRCAPALRVLLVQPDDVARAQITNRLQLEPAELVLGPRAPGETPDDDSELLTGRGPLVAALATAPEVSGASVRLAVGLLSRLPADIIEWGHGQWAEVRVAAGPTGDDLFEVLVALPPDASGPARPDAARPDTPERPPEAPIPEGWRIPLTRAAAEWVAEARAQADEGLVVVVDCVENYSLDLAGVAPRPGVALEQIDPGATAQSHDDEALSPLRVVEWGPPTTGGPSRRSQ